MPTPPAAGLTLPIIVAMAAILCCDYNDGGCHFIVFKLLQLPIVSIAVISVRKLLLKVIAML